MPFQICPFCGVPTEVPHTTQEGCIEALQEEIARVRDIVSHLRGTQEPEDLDSEEPEVV